MKKKSPLAICYCRMRVIKEMLSVLFVFLLPGFLYAQCPVGYNQVIINWDYLDYFSYTGNYTNGNGYLPSNAVAQTQNFVFGNQRVVATNNFSAANNLGENALHTGDAGSYATGTQHINFNGNGTVTFTFENEVQNLQFSIFDTDNSQVVTVMAQNTAAVALPVILSKAVALSASISVNPLPLTAPSATATGASTASNVNTNTINADVAGPVKSITIVFTGSGGDFWLSGIKACDNSIFPLNYYNVSRPFTGQPGYVLHSLNNSVYAVNPANGVTKFLFTDNSSPYGGSSYINSMGYDPYNRFLYYVYSISANPGTNVMIRKYDFNTRLQSTVLADVTTIGIPIVSSTSGFTTRGTGVESGAAAFYGGALYLGIETNNKNSSGNPLSTSGRESVVWRIDFNGSNMPYRSSQVFALPMDDGAGALLHDWSDFVISNGVLYDFDGAGVTTQTDVTHYNLTTGTGIGYPVPAGWTPGQPAVDWQGNLYQFYATSTAPAVNPYVALYNGNGTIGTRFNLSSTPMFTPAIPSLGDAAEAFRPLADFGDAPATYDPLPADPAVHELDASLYLGSTTGIHEDEEWLTRGQTVLANSDNYEDGLGAAPALLNFNGTNNYTVPDISVLNNTGANATLVAWLDYNLNGVFDAAEGRSVTVPSNAAAQLITITWTGIFVPATAATATYLRLRLTRAANGMATTQMTGYMPDGEVEDYRVTMGLNLPVVITSFLVQQEHGKNALIEWTTSGNMTDNAAFEIERSSNGQQWTNVGLVNTIDRLPCPNQFSYTDRGIPPGKSYYRIKILAKDGKYTYTAVKSIYVPFVTGNVTFSPNPVSEYLNIHLTTGQAGVIKITMFDYSGKTVYQKVEPVAVGDNSIRLTAFKNLLPGIYYIKLTMGTWVFTEKISVVKN